MLRGSASAKRAVESGRLTHLVVTFREIGGVSCVLGGHEVGAATDEGCERSGDECAPLQVVHGHSVTLGGAARNGRSSSHSWIGSPPAPGAADSSPASSIARS